MDLFERIRRDKLLSDADLQKTRARVISTREDWGSAICALKLAPERAVVRLLAAHSGYPGIDLSRSVVPVPVASLVPSELLRRRRVLPVVDADGGLVLAMADPDDDALAIEIAFTTGRKVLRHVAVPSLLKTAIEGVLAAAERGEADWRGKEAWSLSPGPQGTAAVVAPPAVDQAVDEGDEPIVVGAEVEPQEVEIVGLLDPAFDAPELPARVARADPEAARTTQRVELGSGKVVLVVDDEPEMRQMVVKVLAPFGCAVVESGDGQEALALAREVRPDLVLLDAMLPRMHGFEVCRAIKGDPELRRTAVLMVSGIHTGWKVGVDVAEVYGADGFFEKPFRVDDLSRAVRRCLMLGGGGEEQAAKARRQAALAACKEAAARARAGKFKEAVDLLQSAAAKDPYSAEPHFYLGQMLKASGDRYRAIAALERAADLRPDLDAPLLLLGELYQAVGFRKTAQAVLRRAADVCTDPARRSELEQRLRALEGSQGA